MNPSTRTSPAPTAPPSASAASALRRPPRQSKPRARQLLTAASEAGIGGLALSCLERIDIGDLDAHDRVTLLRMVTDHGAWLEALQADAVIAVAGPLDGWACDEVAEMIYEVITGHDLPPFDAEDDSPGASACEEGPAADMPLTDGSVCGQREQATATEVNSTTGDPSDFRSHADSSTEDNSGEGRRADMPLTNEPSCGHRACDPQADPLPAPDPIIAAMHQSDAWETRELAAATEVALATTVSKRTAGRRIDTARFLHEHPITLTMARRGLWSYSHLRVCESELISHDDNLIDTVLADVADPDRREPPAKLAQRIRKSLARHDRVAMTERIRANRDVIAADAWMLPDGQGRLAVTAEHSRISEAFSHLNDLADAQRAWMRAAGETVPDAASLRGQLLLDAIAYAHDQQRQGLASPGSATGARSSSTASQFGAGISAQPGSTDESLPAADAILTPLLNPATWTSTPAAVSTDPAAHEGISAQPHGPAIPVPGSAGESARAKRRRTQAAIIVDLPTALGLADEPGFIPGYGWVPADIAREIAADSDEWSRWLVDGTSRSLLDINNTRYRPSEALRRFINARALECSLPVCTRPASESQLDHADDFDGTNTTTANLHPACGPDHLTVTAGYFLVTLDEHGRATWTSTTSGHSYANNAHPLFDAAEPPRQIDEPVSVIEALTHQLLREAA